MQIETEKKIMFLARFRGLRGPFVAQWSPTEDCPRIDIGAGMGVILSGAEPDWIGATFVTPVHDILGREIGIAKCEVV
jgi:hypothetical protein